MFNSNSIEAVPVDGVEKEKSLEAAMAAIDRVVDLNPEEFIGQLKEGN